jgi:ribosome-associated protein
VLTISKNISLALEEIEISAVRSQGPGGQNVNKVSSAVQLRFNVHASTLPQLYKQRILALADRRITKDGMVVIKAQEFRSQEKNKAAALMRLTELIQKALRVPRRRRPTRPSATARARRMDGKTRRSRIKSLRRKVLPE